jgi:hypothetical protein
MFGFGAKWFVVKVVGDKVILTNNSKVVACNIETGKIVYDKKRFSLPKYALDKVQNVIDSRRGVGVSGLR